MPKTPLLVWFVLCSTGCLLIYCSYDKPSAAQLRSAYRSIALDVHPDKIAKGWNLGKDKPTADDDGARMIELTRAKEHLIGTAGVGCYYWSRSTLCQRAGTVRATSGATGSLSSEGLRAGLAHQLAHGLSAEHSTQLLNSTHQFASSFTQDPNTTDTTASLLLAAAVCSSGVLQVLVLVLCLQICHYLLFDFLHALALPMRVALLGTPRSSSQKQELIAPTHARVPESGVAYHTTGRERAVWELQRLAAATRRPDISDHADAMVLVEAKQRAGVTDYTLEDPGAVHLSVALHIVLVVVVHLVQPVYVEYTHPVHLLVLLTPFKPALARLFSLVGAVGLVLNSSILQQQQVTPYATAAVFGAAAMAWLCRLELAIPKRLPSAALHCLQAILGFTASVYGGWSTDWPLLLVLMVAASEQIYSRSGHREQLARTLFSGLVLGTAVRTLVLYTEYPRVTLVESVQAQWALLGAGCWHCWLLYNHTDLRLSGSFGARIVQWLNQCSSALLLLCSSLAFVHVAIPHELFYAIMCLPLVWVEMVNYSSSGSNSN